MIPEIGVGAVIRDGAGRVLLVERGHPPQQGRWALPGGRLNGGETLAHAVAREVWEETRLRVLAGPLLHVAEILGSDYHFVVLDFAVKLDGADQQAHFGSDARRLEWASEEEILRLGDLADGMAALFDTREVREFLGWV